MKDIAIIGVAGRFPEAKNIQELYENLKKGHCSAKRMSKERKRATNLKVNQDYKIFSYLEDVDVFDHKFFKLSMAEAQTMDPHQRLLMEVVYETFESAGYNPDQFWGSNTAVFCGDVSLSYYNLATQYDPTLLTGNLNTITASRISRFFNLRGTNLMVDTNCSSTLMATHLACNELINGDTDYSLVCGVRLVLSPNLEDNTKDEVGIMAFDGKTRSFDAKAEGTGAGEAAACVLLKPLDKALADGDLIYGVIKATAVNQEAMLSGSLTAPSSKAQAEVIRKSWDKAGIDPTTIGYVEPHGSGTKLGDPIEIQGIDMAYQGLTDEKHFVAVSAIKSNIGHTDTVAGLSGMVKVLLSLQNKQLFPTSNFDEPNPFIDFDNSVTYINTELKNWESKSDAPLRAGLSSFGLSGTNCHIILEEAPKRTQEQAESKTVVPVERQELLTLSAQSEAALLRNIERLKQHLEQNPALPLQDISRTLNQGRKHFAYRTALLAKDTPDFAAQLAQITKKAIKNQGVTAKKTLLIFPDKVEQAHELKAQLIELYPEFKANLDKCRTHAKNPASENFADFELQFALYHLLSQHGITSKNLLGIGLGKIVIDAVLEKRPLAECISEAEQLDRAEIPYFGKRFQALIDRETETEKVLFIELAPMSVFTKHLKAVQTPDSADYFDWLSFSFHKQNSFKLLLQKLYLIHQEINWELAQDKTGNKTWLPPYSFEPIRCWLREPSTDEEMPEEKQEIASTISDAAPRVIPTNFDASKVTIDQNWSATEKQIALFWIEILKLEEVSLEDDFFKLGGHSLLATQLISRIEKKYKVRLEFKNIAQFSTIKSLAQGVDELLQSGDGKTQYSAMQKAAEKPYYAVSKAQYRQWLLNQFDPLSLAYNLPRILSMNIALDTHRVEQAIQKLIAKHESLRTSFGTENGEPVQYIHEKVDFKLDVIQAKAADKNQVIENFIQPFDLTQAPLFRVQLVQFAPTEFLFLSDIHHIVSDGVSSDIILNEFMKSYQGQELEPLEFQYKDFSEWQNQLFESGEIQEQENFWLAQFTDAVPDLPTGQAGGRQEIPVLELPTDFKRPTVQTHVGERINYQLSEVHTEKIRKLSQDSGTTIYTTLLAIYKVLLHKYTGSEDLIVGSPTAGRSREELEHILGMFVNTIAIRSYPKSEHAFKHFLSELKENIFSIFEHQDYPFEMLVDRLDIKRDLSRNPLFDTMFSYQNFYRQENQASNETDTALDIKPFGFNNSVSKFDITFEVTENDKHLNFHIEYATDLFRKESIERMISHLVLLIEQISDSPNIQLGQLKLNTPEEEKYLLNDLNANETDYPGKLSLSKLFEKQVELHPNRPALRFEKQELTYLELNQKSNRFAHHLLKLGLKKNEPVVLIMNRSFDMYAGMLGILKADAYYIPVDPDFPSERQHFIIEDSACRFVLTNLDFEHSISENVAFIHTKNPEIEVSSSENIPAISTGDDPAYMIYTSGSTGNPKGTLIPHKAVSRIALHTNYLTILPEDKILQLSNYAFDGSVFDIFGALLNGAKLVVIEKEKISDLNALVNFIKEEQISISFVTTALFNILVDKDLSVFKHLRKILFGGEKASVPHVRKAFDFLGKDVLIHVYGPTECTVFATYYPVVKLEERAQTIPIGKVLSNTKAYVLDQQKNLQGIGIFGELYLSGEGLALEYFNHPELTEQVFVSHPFLKGQKIYKTGDLVKMSLDGNIEFIGRVDQQVKIRGFRIEPDEIKQFLLKHPDISDAFVAAKTIEGELSLVAYYVLRKTVTRSELATYLKDKLPAYMIPAFWVETERIPLNSSGKIDVKNLSLPETSLFGEMKKAPENENEQLILELFSEVLRSTNIGTDENFFEIGGHSLRATQLLSGIYKKTGVQISLKDFFLESTVQSLAKRIDNPSQQVAFEALPKAAEKESYALSTAQKRLHFLQQLDSESIAYNIPGAIRISGKLDKNQLIKAFGLLIERHASLRTDFREQGEEIRQFVHQKVEPNVQIEQCTETEVNQRVNRFIQAFRLDKAPLIRLLLLEIGEENQVMVFDMHHIITDGTSMMILIDEFFQLYKGKILKSVDYQYIDYSEWQNSESGKAAYEQQKAYWMNQFTGEIPVLNLPADYPRPELNDFKGARLLLQLSAEKLGEIRKLNQSYGTTNFMFFLAVFNMVLSKHGNTEDIIVGTPVAGRKHKDLDQIIGMFVNTLVFYNQTKHDLSFGDFLKQVKENVINALENQEYPYEELVENLQIKRDTSRNPLFDVFFVYQNLQKNQESQLDEDLQITPLSVETAVSKFDLTLEIQENGDYVQVIFEYATSLFSEKTIQRLADHFSKAIEELCKNSSQQIGTVDFLTASEKQQLLHDFNATKVEYPTASTIVSLFEEQAALTPENIAVTFKNTNLTYLELDQLANQVAHGLLAEGIQKGDLVAVLLERNEKMLAALLGIMKASAAYVPIDPAYPQERVDYLLSDSGAKLVLDEAFVSRFLTCLPIPTAGAASGTAVNNLYSTEKPDVSVISSDLAYIIYTSGSTGFPKGVCLTHSNAASFIHWCNDEFKNTPFEVVFAGTSYSFDLSIFEFFYTLQTGKRIRLLTSGLDISEYLNTERNILINTVPTVVNELLESDADLSNVTAINMAGEAIPTSIKSNLPLDKIEVRNLYGPSEDTTYSTCFRILENDSRQLIGKPIANTNAYVLDKNMELLPLGIAGELCLSGAGLSLGYLNKAELTAEKFVPNPWIPNVTMYKTGDLVRWMEDGSLEYLGRIDHQVKIRGFRIELGEIESKLLAIEGIRESIVVDKTDKQGSKFLCAYITADYEVEVQKLRQTLSKSLPEYMVPSIIIPLEKMPLTPNGKIDRKRLPEPDGSFGLTTEYVAPNTETEKILVEIWQKILGLELVGIYDNFFEIGGHSLKATQMVTNILKKTGVNVSLIEIFKHPTVSELSAIITQSEKSIYTNIVPIEKRPYYPASSAQKRLYVISRINESGIQYNMPYALEIVGEIDYKRIENTLHKLIDRHESLRTDFEVHDSEVIQLIHPTVDFKIQYVSCTEEELANEVNRFIQPFDMHKAPLVRVILFQTNTKRNVVLFDMHHALSDGLSMQILSAEFMHLYEGLELTPLQLHYRDYAVWQQEFFHKHENQKQADFWLKQFEGDVPLLNLPLDFPRPAIQSYEGESIALMLPKEFVKGIKSAALKAKSTSFMYLFSVYNVLLSKYCSQEDLVIGTPVAGRPHADLHLLIGMFVNTLAIRNYPKAEKTFAAFLEELTHNTLSCMDHQEYPFEDLVDQVVQNRDMSRNPLFDVLFSYQNLQTQGEYKEPPIRFKSFGVQVNTSKFDLQLDVSDFESDMQIAFTYCTRLFKKETVERMMKHFVFLLEQVLENENTVIKDLQLISDSESKQILVDFNNTAHTFEDTITLQELFERQVSQTPDATALVFERETLSYTELNAKANQLAYLLRDLGIGADDLVAIKIDRSLEMVIGMLAALKAGGAYMPIDPEVPSERLKFLLQDSKAKVMLTDRDFEVGDLTTKVLNLNDQSIFSGSVENPKLGSNNTNLAYVIYTSGSTGNPKGVQLEHKGVVNRIEWMKEFYGFSSAETVLQKTTYTFDVSVWEFFMTLSYGAKLVLCKKEVISDVSLLIDIIEKQQISVLHFVPSMFKVFLAGIDERNAHRLSSIKQIFASGEALSAEYVQTHHKYLKAELHNLYGPTEASVDVSYYETKGTDTTVPIGKPVWNTQLLILDSNLNLLPVGVPGELHIGGIQLARAYMNQPELTAEKFIVHPCLPAGKAGIPNDRLYKTGDLAKWLPDGSIDYLGRIDHQVKIRGFRIELGDIESQLLKMGFPEVAVIDRMDKNNDKYLCAYIVSPEELNITEIKATLAKDLPEYMVPSYFVRMDEMPLGSSGKLNRKALPEPDESSLEKAEYAAPETEIEILLSEIWQRILGVKQVSANDHFFNLGGDSIKAIQVSAILLKSKLKLELSNLFQFPTLREVAKTIKKSIADIPQEAVSGEVLLTPIQKHFFERNYQRPEHYNQAIMLESHEKINAGTITQVLTKLEIHHDSLRMQFSNSDSEIKQINKGLENNSFYTFTEIDLTADENPEQEIQQQADSLQASFSLFGGTLFQVALFHTKEVDYLLLIAHHLIIDAVSWRILIEDLIKAYHQAQGGNSIQFEEKTHSYQHWSKAINDYAQGSSILKELDYWKTLENYSYSPIVTNKAENGQKTLESQNFQLNTKDTEILLKHVNRVYQTEINDILLTSLGMALKKWNGMDEVLIHLEGHGREDILENTEISRTVGWFTSIFPVRITTKADITEENIAANRDYLKAIPNKGIGYGILRYLTPAENKAGYEFKAEPEIIFNYLGQLGSSETKESTNNSEKPKGLFLSGMHTGKSIATVNEGEYALSISALVSNGSLQLSVNYLSQTFDKQSIEKLLKAYEKSLTEIIRTAEKTSLPQALVETKAPEESTGFDVMAGLEKLITTPILTLKDNQQAENIFFFPPAIGFSMVYQDLASQLSEYNVYGVNFLEDETRMDTYIKDLLRINGNKAFVFAGYSGGANLAYQVALELVKRGHEVSDIIMLDGMRTLESKTLNPEELQEQTYQYIGEEEGHPAQRLLKTKAERDRVRRIVSSYQQYLSQTADNETLSTQVHQIHSEQQWEEGKIRKEKWDEIIKGQLLHYQGKGEHGSMLFDDNFEYNTNIFKNILLAIRQNQEQIEEYDSSNDLENQE